jgi:uncharacterized membrane protein
MKKSVLKIVLIIIGAVLIAYGMQKGMELDKLISVTLGGGLIGIASRN